MNVELQKMSIYFKANKFSLSLSLNLTKASGHFLTRKRKHLIADDLPILYIDNFEIVNRKCKQSLSYLH